MNTPKITVFGGSKPKPGEPAYQQAYNLGALLGGAGYTVLTGGYIGTMEAVSRGAAEHGGHVIGVTCDEIENWRDVGPNQWVMEEWRYPTLQARIDALIDHSQAAIALPGGVGTLTEIVLAWNRMLIESVNLEALITIGDTWKKTISTFLQHEDGYIPPQGLATVQFADTVQTAFDLVQAALKPEV